ncbi:MAG TPA: Uma2 family endonuclease [Anaerolineae bacterium]|nr:Uma2 family endonuclease [Anaerolineae bacterium]
MTMIKTAHPQKIIYPESDGKPMGETDAHITALIYLMNALRDHFRDNPQVYVAGNMFLYYEEGDPAAVVAPDVFVVKGVTKYKRRTYKMWEEKQAPAVIFELTSRSTRLDDLGSKRVVYEMLGVQEYYLFDPYGEYLEPRLWAYQLERNDDGYSEYLRIMGNTVYSPALDLNLFPDGDLLRLQTPKTGEKLLSDLEAQAARRAEAEARRAETEARRAETEARRAAEAEAAHLRAELARLQAALDKK